LSSCDSPRKANAPNLADLSSGLAKRGDGRAEYAMPTLFRPDSRLLRLIACATLLICPPAHAAAEVARDGDVWRARIGEAAVYDGPRWSPPSKRRSMA
jgi:hypothetical protein